MISLGLWFIIGLVAGLGYRDLSDKVKDLQEKLSERKANPAVTMGAYVPPKAISNFNDSQIGLVDAKTPQRLEWEARQKLERTIKEGSIR